MDGRTTRAGTSGSTGARRRRRDRLLDALMIERFGYLRDLIRERQWMPPPPPRGPVELDPWDVIVSRRAVLLGEDEPDGTGHGTDR